MKNNKNCRNLAWLLQYSVDNLYGHATGGIYDYPDESTRIYME